MIVTKDLDGMIDELRKSGQVSAAMWPRLERGGRSSCKIHREMSSNYSSTQNVRTEPRRMRSH
jgi:hypothetical protein